MITRRDFKEIVFAKPHALECAPVEVDIYIYITLFSKKLTGFVSCPALQKTNNQTKKFLSCQSFGRTYAKYETTKTTD